jgi:predicted  nucleic acid-binding Zn-ribbon protein
LSYRLTCTYCGVDTWADDIIAFQKLARPCDHCGQREFKAKKMERGGNAFGYDLEEEATAAAIKKIEADAKKAFEKTNSANLTDPTADQPSLYDDDDQFPYFD